MKPVGCARRRARRARCTAAFAQRHRGRDAAIATPTRSIARKILKLDALDELVEDPTAQDRGKLLHNIVETFATTYPEQLPTDAPGQLDRHRRRGCSMNMMTYPRCAPSGGRASC